LFSLYGRCMIVSFILSFFPYPSRQKGIYLGKAHASELTDKMFYLRKVLSFSLPYSIRSFLTESIQDLGIPFQVFAAIADDIWRKPHASMHLFYSEKCNGGVPIETSFYVGDAAGRPAGWDSTNTQNRISIYLSLSLSHTHTHTHSHSHSLFPLSLNF